ncbi:hypothetical protein OB919_11995 [Halobacteria archaeon AArc-curdl1]|uniref:DUF8048 domain-containing protein n=1 Tax=Natronosalvus hydrolyticus TaxID=2979988 RepID=A0AAP2Z8J5_9EURY|nr:hypothetical protein [Halobacteria archaeon AArc-curdl1]
MSEDPIDGQVLLLTGAKASIAPAQLPPLIETVQETLATDLETLAARYECIYETDDRAVFLVEDGYWEDLGAALGLERREWDAVRRAHTEQFTRFGRRCDRLAEFEAALEIRDPVVVARPDE